jgi:hypothetical protein
VTCVVAIVREEREERGGDSAWWSCVPCAVIVREERDDSA